MKKLQESGEMYLENILILSRNNPQVRSIDICEYMGFSKPSISRAVSILKSDGYITVDKDGNIKLTNLGLEVAEKVYDRHQTLSTFLEDIGVQGDVAAADACRIEHVISDSTMEAIKAFMKKK